MTFQFFDTDLALPSSMARITVNHPSGFRKVFFHSRSKRAFPRRVNLLFFHPPLPFPLLLLKPEALQLKPSFLRCGFFSDPELEIGPDTRHDHIADFGKLICRSWKKGLTDHFAEVGKIVDIVTGRPCPCPRPKKLGYFFSSPPLFDADLILRYLF